MAVLAWVTMCSGGCEAEVRKEESGGQAGVAKEKLLDDVSTRLLMDKGWAERVGDGRGVWVSIRDQRFRLIEAGRIIWEVACSTAAKGAGSKVNSFKTPLGWHRVKEKAGTGEPIGRVFRERKATRELWHPGDKVKEDLVLTRVLALDGEEPGANKGGDVDSFARGIYIHGTNDEANIGKPVSHGCVRLTNENAVKAYDLIPESTLVLITE